MHHDAMQTLVAAYAADALDRDEREEVRRHLDACEACRADLEDFEQTLSWLSLATEPAALPVGFTQRVLARRPEPVREVVSPTAAPRSWQVLVAAALVGLIGVATWSAISFRDSRDELRNQRAVIRALVQGDEQIVLEGAGGAAARVVPTEEGALFVASGLPPLREGVAYQLWIKDGDLITSGGTFQSSQGTAVVRIDRRFGNFSGALVTAEPEGGSRQPTSSPVVDSL